jgi:hypothetical protein
VGSGGGTETEAFSTLLLSKKEKLPFAFSTGTVSLDHEYIKRIQKAISRSLSLSLSHSHTLTKNDCEP